MREINLTDRERSLVAEAVDRMRATALETWNGVPAEALAAERKRVREALLAEIERESFAVGLFGVTFPGGKVALRTADMVAGVNRILGDEGAVFFESQADEDARRQSFGQHLRSTVGDVYDAQATPRPEAGALERERFAATQGRDGEREAVLRFLERFRERLTDYTLGGERAMVATLIHEIREGSHVTKGGE